MQLLEAIYSPGNSTGLLPQGVDREEGETEARLFKGVTQDLAARDKVAAAARRIHMDQLVAASLGRPPAMPAPASTFFVNRILDPSQQQQQQGGAGQEQLQLDGSDAGARWQHHPVLQQPLHNHPPQPAMRRLFLGRRFNPHRHGFEPDRQPDSK